MSLRTKLLAAVVGLNGAILLLALFLLLRSEEQSSPQPFRHALAELPAIGAALAGVSSSPRDRLHAQQLVADLQEAGPVQEILVVEEEIAEAGGRRSHRVWTADAWLSASTPGEELTDDAVRQRAIGAFESARRDADRWSWTDPSGETVALVLPGGVEPRGRRGLVLRYEPPPDPRRGVKDVYVVIVAGVLLLTGVSFWLVSRLVIRPLEQLTDAADRIARGDYRIRVERRGTGDEFDRTKGAFNRMAREIAEYQGHLEDRVLSALNRMRKAEQHLAIAQRLAATGKLASGVAHEINNPLGGMKNAVRALARGDLTPEKTEEYVDLISEGLGRVEETVKKFLSFTPRRVEPRPTDLADVARKAGGLARHRIERNGARLEEALPEPGESDVFGDPHELQQVALNLLLNAADAVGAAREGAGGETAAPGRIHLRVARQGDEVVLEVEDDGVGLSPEDQDRCFDMFFTTKGVGEGTGLGLAVAHTIVTNHGGRFEVESEAGAGATFRVLLPGEGAVAPRA